MLDLSPYDLHIHTRYSDGKATPRELFEYISQLGLKGFAITDHETVAGSKEALSISQDYSLHFITGIEQYGKWESQQVYMDVLGYFIDVDNHALQEHLRSGRDFLLNAFSEYCDYLTGAGYPLQVADVLAINPHYICAPNFLTALVHKGHAINHQQARQLVQAHIPFVYRWPHTVEDNIRSIHAAGGVAVLAHPCRISSNNPDQPYVTAEAIGELVDMGLDGIEVHHPMMKPDAKAYFSTIAETYGLCITGGCDLHSIVEFLLLGTQPVTEGMVQTLMNRR